PAKSLQQISSCLSDSCAACKRPSSSRPVTSQMRMVVSRLPEARRRPSGENDKAATSPPCPTKRARSLPLAVSNNRTEPPSPDSASVRPSGENAQAPNQCGVTPAINDERSPSVNRRGGPTLTPDWRDSSRSSDHKWIALSWLPAR